MWLVRIGSQPLRIPLSVDEMFRHGPFSYSTQYFIQKLHTVGNNVVRQHTCIFTYIRTPKCGNSLFLLIFKKSEPPVAGTSAGYLTTSITFRKLGSLVLDTHKNVVCRKRNGRHSQETSFGTSMDYWTTSANLSENRACCF